MLTPISLLSGLLFGILALALPVLGVSLLYRALRRPKQIVTIRHRGDVHTQPVLKAAHQEHKMTWQERLREPSSLAALIAGALLVLFTLAGGSIIRLAFPSGPDEPSAVRGTSTELTRSHGTKIHVELYGPEDGPTLILTHGWGTNSSEWYYAKRHLAQRFHLIVWDLPRPGQSEQPRDRDYALEKMAADLRSVLTLAKGRPAVLVGHSIGGMINLTFARVYPELLGSKVAGIVEVDTTYTNPVKTTQNSGFSLAIQKPIAEPLLHAMIILSPLLHAVNWLRYEEGLTHLENARSSFAGSETRGQVDLLSRTQVEASPAVVARGTLAMFHWDAEAVLQHVKNPVLIIVGQEDTTTLPSASEQMHKAIAQSNLRTLHPSAHYALLEQNDTVDDAVAQFASSILK